MWIHTCPCFHSVNPKSQSFAQRLAESPTSQVPSVVPATSHESNTTAAFGRDPNQLQSQMIEPYSFTCGTWLSDSICLTRCFDIFKSHIGKSIHWGACRQLGLMFFQPNWINKWCLWASFSSPRPLSRCRQNGKNHARLRGMLGVLIFLCRCIRRNLLALSSLVSFGSSGLCCTKLPKNHPCSWIVQKMASKI